MKRIYALLSAIVFFTFITLSVVNAQEPEKKATETKAKTEGCCSKEKSKDCSTACDKKAKEEPKTTEETKVEKK
ncbi:MAG: hypothetical protein A2X13_03130 [Bacteroidetes bacterium GWC2_33_15]|nr:MAG: hypothetical protein A2X10_09665 [Bacteroidetes bacterium GWA2_33_15]OFX49538.1 MAG: hypothetical protein A2X13_03130 [Bacteroidetes bacterium GWC2_33_15]OFX63623.1 MAG: hypothetical protein A2X15_01095 [Bacteroidetes bacterium GWB2_32_14]OFX68837.1 MAG: hypothetical protein A2X14_13090 [Bacteroidetes bacterium GWD2_33_33]HAN17568.1 hypothetical protein [Bacteroidales bacterium]